MSCGPPVGHHSSPWTILFHRYSNWYSTTYLTLVLDKCISSVNVSLCISKRYKLLKKLFCFFTIIRPSQKFLNTIKYLVFTFCFFLTLFSGCLVYRNQRRSIMKLICLLCLFFKRFSTPSVFFFSCNILIEEWRRQWHPTPVLLLGKSHGWRSLVGCNLWGR